MLKPIRRVVTGIDANGKAIVGIDGPPKNVKVRKASGGLISTLIWTTDETPADISALNDRADREVGVGPSPRGSVFRVVDFPPTAEGTLMDNDAVIREMGIHESVAKDGQAARHPLMHRTRSIDYAVVISGEMDMLLDDSEIHLSAGDVLVQQGTNHAWVNRGSETCRIAFVLIDAEEPAQTGKG